MKKVLYAGSFYPFTDGHKAVVERALKVFGKVVIAVMVNSDKFIPESTEERAEAVKKLYAGNPDVEVVWDNGYTADLARKLGADYLVRGVRDAFDFGYETKIAAFNFQRTGINTFYFLADEKHKNVSSTKIRQRSCT